MRTLLVVLILVPGLIAAVRSRFAALLLYVWFALFRPEQWLYVDITSYRPSLLLGLLLVIPSVATGILPNLTHPLSIGALAFLISGLIAQTNAVNSSLGWYWIDYLWRLLLICSLAVTLLNTQRRIVLFVGVIALSFGFFTAKAGLVSMLAGGLRFGDGLSGAFSDNNGYAVGTAMILPFLLVSGQIVKRRAIRMGLYAAVAASMFTIVSTYSRGGFLAMAGAVLTYVLLQRRRAVALTVLGVLAASLVFVPVPKGYTQRLQTIQTYDEIGEESALGRLHFWRVAMDMFSHQPLGVGLRNYEATYDRYDDSGGTFGTGRSVHSSHFQVLAENGVIGIVAWVGCFGYAFWCAFRIRRRSKDSRLDGDQQRFLFVMANALIVSMVSFLIGGAFVALALNDLTWMTFAVVASLDRVSARMLVEAEAAQPVRAAAAPVFATGLASRALGRGGALR